MENFKNNIGFIYEYEFYRSTSAAVRMINEMYETGVAKKIFAVCFVPGKYKCYLYYHAIIKKTLNNSLDYPSQLKVSSLRLPIVPEEAQ